MLLFLVLHNVRSLHNVGSIFRTADAAGVTKIYLTGYTPTPYDFFGPPAGGLRKDFAKTALGAEKFVEWEQRKNITSLLKYLKKSHNLRNGEQLEKRLTSPPNPLSLQRRGGKKRDVNLSSGGEAFLHSKGGVFIVSLEQSSHAIPYNKFTTIYRSKFKRRNKVLPRYAAIALIVGNEVRGLTPAILKKSDAIIEIPMYGKKESLNVSVAAGVALYELTKI